MYIKYIMAYTRRRRTSKNKMHNSRSNRSNAGSKNRSKNSWPMFVKKVYHEEHKKNKNFTFKEALQMASELKKQGKM